MTSDVIFVVLEFEDGLPSENSLELISAAMAARKGDPEVLAVCLGFEITDSALSELAARGANKVVVVDDQVLDPYLAEPWVKELTALAGEYGPSHILFPHSAFGMDCAPRLAFRLETAVVTGCVGIEDVDGITHWTRSCYGGNAGEIVTLLTSPNIATVVPRSFEPLALEAKNKASVDKRSSIVKGSELRTRVLARPERRKLGVRLETANIVVSGGRGLGGPEQFDQLAELADLLGGAPGASRVACDLGWCPSSWQVGLSGKTVAPQLYLAMGISGAVQHMSGCGNSKMIVAINNDPEAEIFKSAGLGIVADCTEILPALIEEIKRIRGIVRLNSLEVH